MLLLVVAFEIETNPKEGALILHHALPKKYTF
jgi:hypothetical protein